MNSTVYFPINQGQKEYKCKINLFSDDPDISNGPITISKRSTNSGWFLDDGIECPPKTLYSAGHINGLKYYLVYCDENSICGSVPGCLERPDDIHFLYRIMPDQKKEYTHIYNYVAGKDLIDMSYLTNDITKLEISNDKVSPKIKFGKLTFDLFFLVHQIREEDFCFHDISQFEKPISNSTFGMDEVIL